MDRANGTSGTRAVQSRYANSPALAKYRYHNAAPVPRIRTTSPRRSGKRNTTDRLRRAASRARFRVSLVLTSMAIVTVLGSVLGLVAVRNGVADQLTGALGNGSPGSGAIATATASCASTSPATPPAAAAASPTTASSPSAGIGTDVPCAASPNPLPTPYAGVPYSHSWYVDTPDSLASFGTSDAQWLNSEAAHAAATTQQSFVTSDGATHAAATGSCAMDFLTVLDFGHPTREFKGNASPLDDYAMTLFGVRSQWRTYRQVEQLTEGYLDAWMAAASHCLQLHLVMGTSNYFECRDATVACDVATAGQDWDVVTHDIMDYVAAKGYGSQVLGVWVGDDLETSWDSWATTSSFLSAVQQQEGSYTLHAALVDYGDAAVGACSIVARGCKHTWSAQNVYDAAWGIGWNVPLPETYDPTTTQRWMNIAHLQGGAGTMSFAGVMTECAGADPLPAGSCHPQKETEAGPIANASACQWSPTIAFNQVHASDVGQSLAYATNMQWSDPPADDQTSTGDCSG